MAYSSNIAKTKRDGQIDIISGNPTTYEANFAVGDFSFEFAKAELITIYDRATIVGARKGNDPLINGTFSVHLRSLYDAANDSLPELIATGTLSGVAQTSTGGTGYEPKLYTVRYTIDATALGDGKTYVATFNKCQLLMNITEGDPDVLAVTFTCLGGVVFT